MNLNWLDLFLLIFASLRLTRLIVFDKITEFIRKPFHEVVEETLPDGTKAAYLKIKGSGMKGFLGELLSCYWCTGFWSSFLIVISYLYFPYFAFPIIIIFAISGSAAFLETILEKIQGN